MGIETALLAAATTATTAAGTTAVALPWLTTTGSLASIASAGGTAGTIAGLGGSVATGLSALSGISSVLSGIQGVQAGRQQASLAKQQAGLQAAESVRQADREARFEAERVNQVTRRLKLAYLKSGVTLEGSPLLVMEETRKRGADNIDEILQGGRYAANASMAEGRIQARSFRTQGRSAFIQGLSGGARQLAGVFA